MWWWVAVALLSACAPVDVDGVRVTVRLSATGDMLRSAAAQTLRAGGVAVVADDSAPLLVLRETTAEEVANVASDGSIAAYLVTYSLYYRIGGGEEKTIIRERTVSHNENRFHAGRQQRLGMINSLRRNALTRLLYSLPKQ